ncbi:response regulator transcription factor [Lactobacillaceae bacterium L1_55_11]|nr:response regulator transcription factor [Lactobacillaceae bacterium L1_55_11]
MNYYLLEDARVDQRYIKKLIPTIKIFDSPRELMAVFKDDSEPKIIILDIEIKGVVRAGLEIARLIRQHDPHAQIIMISHHEDLMPVCLEYHIAAIDFIPKKIDERYFADRLLEAIKTAQDNIEKIAAVAVIPIKLPNGAHTYKVNLNDILYIASEKATHYLEVFTTDGIIKIRANLKDIPQVHPQLIQIHAAYCINIDRLETYTTKTHTACLSNGVHLPVSRRFIARLREEID